MKKDQIKKYCGAAAVLLAVLICFGLAACTKSDEDQNARSVDVSAADTVVSEVPPEVSLSDMALEIGKGLTYQLKASGGENLTFASSDEGVASVDESGTVTGVSAGECDITVRNEYGNFAACRVAVKKVCYLTFDDGPNEHTESILAALRDNNARATFFVVSSKYLPLTKNMQEQGCVVGLHTYSHEYNICYHTEYSYYWGLDKLSDIVEKHTGTRPYLIRFPGGTHNAVSDPLLMRRVLNGAYDLGYRPFDWTASAGDTSLTHASADYSFEQVKKSCTEDEEIVLMHEKGFNAVALQRIIPYLRDEGYVFETLDKYPGEPYTAKPRYSKRNADVPSRSVRITHKEFSIKVDGNFTLTARMNPSNSTDYVRWESADPSIAIVKADGTVIGISKGTVEIYAITTSGQRGVCKMTVK